MIEPTIYNPSIYKGPTVYNNGGGGTVTDEYIVVQPIDGVEMPDGRIWATKNLMVTPFGIDKGENWQKTPPEMFQYAGVADPKVYGYYYNFAAANYINANRAELIPGWHIPTKSEWATLFSSVANNYSTLSNAGFNDKKCGAMTPGTGDWTDITQYSFYWSQTGDGAELAWVAFMKPSDPLQLSSQWRPTMCPIRIIKDSA